MTISSTYFPTVVEGDGSTTEFTIGFEFQHNSQLAVYLWEAGVETYVEEGEDPAKYTVTGMDPLVADSPGTTIVMGTAPAVGQALIIKLGIGYTQPVEYSGSSAFPAADHEEQMDAMALQIQQLNDIVTRSIQFPVYPSATNEELNARTYIETIQSAQTDTAASELAAAASESAASDSAAAALVSEQNAGISAGLAAGAEIQATTQSLLASGYSDAALAQSIIATEQAVIASAQAGIATAQAGIATTKSADAEAFSAAAGSAANTATTKAAAAAASADAAAISAAAAAAATTASGIATTPAGGLASSNVQAALNELDTEKSTWLTPSVIGPSTPDGTGFAVGATRFIAVTFAALGTGSIYFLLPNATTKQKGYTVYFYNAATPDIPAVLQIYRQDETGFAISSMNNPVQPGELRGVILVDNTTAPGTWYPIYSVNGIAEVTATIANNQAAAADVVGMYFNPSTFRSFTCDYNIYRKTTGAGATELAEQGTLKGVFSTVAGTWELGQDTVGNSGVTLTVTNSGQVQYTSTNITGTGSISKMTFKSRTLGV